jgi:hypothetical protein
MLTVERLNLSHAVAHDKAEQLAVVCKRPQIVEVQLDIQDWYFRGKTRLDHLGSFWV